ncbi:MAG: hypothetical protein AAF797_15230 [Planctomycetota bacterium]
MVRYLSLLLVTVWNLQGCSSSTEPAIPSLQVVDQSQIGPVPKNSHELAFQWASVRFNHAVLRPEHIHTTNPTKDWIKVRSIRTNTWNQTHAWRVDVYPNPTTLVWPVDIPVLTGSRLHFSVTKQKHLLLRSLNDGKQLGSIWIVGNTVIADDVPDNGWTGAAASKREQHSTGSFSVFGPPLRDTQLLASITASQRRLLAKAADVQAQQHTSMLQRIDRMAKSLNSGEYRIKGSGIFSTDSFKYISRKDIEDAIDAAESSDFWASPQLDLQRHRNVLHSAVKDYDRQKRAQAEHDEWKKRVETHFRVRPTRSRFKASVLNRQVKIGMTKYEVYLVFGRPSDTSTTEFRDHVTERHWYESSRTHVGFTDGVVDVIRRD